jgi:purine catabolism regulatory family protein/PucR-like helix-turn-helix protein
LEDPQAAGILPKMPGAPEFTLGDLLDHTELGLELLVGGEGTRARTVTGAHAIEIEQPARWLDADWVMLTTGMALARSPAKQRELIAELDDAGVAALGVGLGLGAARAGVPAGLLAEARRRDFPLFVVPLETPFRDVTAAVFRDVVSDELRAAGRLAAMQRYLIDALGDESPRRAVLERLAALLDATVAVLRADGGVVLATGDLPSTAIARQIGGRLGATVSFDAAGREGLAVRSGDPEDARQGVEAWLVVAARRGQRVHALARAAAQATVPLLLAIARLEGEQRRRERAARDATLEALLRGADAHEQRAAAARALADGIDVARGVVVAVAGPLRPAALPEVERACAEARLPLLARAEPEAERVVALLPVPLEDERLARCFGAAGPAVRIGIGRTVADPGAIGRSLADAELAHAEVGRRPSGAAERLLRYDDLDLAAVLAAELSSERLAPKLDRWLDPLRANAAVYETVVVHMRNELDVGRTARQLGIHPNSVRYRLARAEALLGSPLRATATIATLHLALERHA